MLKVSVVVPVHNPGRHLRRCVTSLVRQTMSPADYEVIFVDDGSTDGTSVQLDELAALHPQVRVLHQANSGWPGQPRNRGLDESRGEYVFFCDDDDWLALEALERLYGFALDNGSDIVLGKMAGVGRPVPQVLFTRTRPVAELTDAPLMDSLTAHKLFRRSFLIRHNIRFAEGRRRLEDHLFVVQAYLEADVISIYAERTCYFHTRRPSSVTSQTPHWPSYFANLEEAVDVVEQRIEPGPMRDRLLTRWLRVEMVNRLSVPAVTKLNPQQVAALFDAAHQVARRHFGNGVINRINPADRPVGRAIVEGTLPVIEKRAALLSQWQLSAQILQIGWADTTLQLSGTVELRDHLRAEAGGAEARFGALFTDLESGVLDNERGAAPLTVDLEDPLTGERVPLEATTHGVGLARSFTVDIDVGQLGIAGATGGSWSFHAQFSLLGVGGRVPMTMVDERSLLFPVAASVMTTRPVAVITGTGQRVELVVGAADRRPGAKIRPSHPVRTAVKRMVATMTARSRPTRSMTRP